MLKLLLGTDWIANRDEVLSRLARDVAREQGGRVLMVPELISHDTERRLCRAAGDTASRYAEVLSFSRLASRVSEYAGVGMEPCMDAGGRLVAMAAAVRRMSSRLKAYARVETRPEFFTGLVEAVDEFKRCCITPADLREAAARTQGGLAQKLEELALILEGYDAVCAQGKRDPRDQMNWLLETLEDSDYARNHTFYIDGFPDFTRQHMAILAHLIRCAPEVTVSLTCDEAGSSAMAFEKAGQTARELLRCAKEVGAAVQIIRVEPRQGALQALRQGLFQGRAERQPELDGRLIPARTESLYRECTAAAERILELTAEGCRYRDISLVCTDINAYRSTLNLVLHRCHIPFYLAGTEDILEKSVVYTVLTAIDAASGGFDRSMVMRYLRSALSALDPDTVDEMENYAVLWGIRGNRWLSQWTSHPDGLSAPWDDDARQRLEDLNQARRSALEPLERLGRGLSGARNLEEQVGAVYRFLEENDLARRLSEMAREMEQAGDGRSAQELNQLWEILLSALEQLSDVLGQTVWDTESFSRLLRLLLSQYDVGTIPTVLDALTLGPVSAMRCQQARHLLVLGAAEGFLPAYGGSAGVLTDPERVELRRLGVPLTGGAMEGVQAEFAEIYGVFCGAEETVYVSCSAEQPSFVYRRLAQMAREEWLSGELGAALADGREAGAYLAAAGALPQARELGLEADYQAVKAQADYHMGQVDRAHISGLYGSRLRLSASQVDCLAECRMRYFLQYGLRARERKEITVDPAEFGTFAHAVLENTARQVRDLGGFHVVSLEKTLEISQGFAGQYADERFSQLDSRRVRYLLRRNCRELELVVRELWEELHRSDFAPVDFEVHFGGDGKMPAIGISGGGLPAELGGFVDRVDVWHGPGGDYFRVVDYKTGAKSFDYCDVFNGVGLQMLLYLFALEQAGGAVVGDHARGAGVQYFPARVPLISVAGRNDKDAEKKRQKQWRRQGLLLAEEPVLLAMEPEQTPVRMDYSRRADGTLSGNLADGRQFALLRRYLDQVLAGLVGQIASGRVDPNPYTRGAGRDACAFCPYGAICHKESVEGRRNYQAMDARRFWEEIEKEVERHG